MFIVEIIGGLGNQMFCYAFAKAIEHHYGQGSVALYTGRFKDTPDNRGYELDYVFGINDPIINEEKEISSLLDNSWSVAARLRRKLFGAKKSYFNEQIYTYDPRVFDLDTKVKRIYLQGLWKNEKYFKNIRPLILNSFSFKRQLNEKNQHLLEQIKRTSSVSLHVRRGDYISNEIYKSIVGDVCSYDYYLNSLRYLEEKLGPGLSYFIFSDDIDWVKENLNFLNDRDTVFIGHNTGKDSYIDMQLMSQCKHNIIANSTFSWWGTWLNQTPDKIVIAPKMWYNDYERCKNNDIVPEEWVKIKNK